MCITPTFTIRKGPYISCQTILKLYIRLFWTRGFQERIEKNTFDSSLKKHTDWTRFFSWGEPPDLRTSNSPIQLNLPPNSCETTRKSRAEKHFETVVVCF
mmetsp:Transcript_58218/g.70082  ORF Transcript_58218/g.70082 Transcript_58218/m.70082 type:complete len:100 (+) Transcript_58218:262-561(+)